MLLIIKYRPILSAEFYDRVLEKVITRYFVDFEDHQDEFMPIFLINDIQRFWKTLCLNYEYARNSRDTETDSAKSEVYLNNIKLKTQVLLHVI